MTSTSMRDDHINRVTRALALVIIPFLVAAAGILYLVPERSGELFAWPIKPPMTAMMLASAYFGGIYFFARVALARQWHTIKVGFWPVTAFAGTLGIATLLHWDKFTPNHISFFTWAALYLTTPFLVVAVWLMNRRADPGAPAPDEVTLPKPLRWALGTVGGVTLSIGLLLFLQPQLMIAAWPWTLTPLTARVAGAMFALPGLVGLGLATDARWSAAKIILEAQALSIAFILLAALRDWGSFDAAQPAAWLFVGGLAALLVGIVAMRMIFERRRARGQPARER